MLIQPPASRLNRLVGQFIDGIIGGAPFLVGLFLVRGNNVLGLALIVAGLGWSVFYYLFAD